MLSTLDVYGRQQNPRLLESKIRGQSSEWSRKVGQIQGLPLCMEGPFSADVAGSMLVSLPVPAAAQGCRAQIWNAVSGNAEMP